MTNEQFRLLNEGCHLSLCRCITEFRHSSLTKPNFDVRDRSSYVLDERIKILSAFVYRISACDIVLDVFIGVLLSGLAPAYTSWCAE